MKKKMLLFFALLASIILAPSFLQVKAEETPEDIQFSTIYPENILDYRNLDGLTHLTANDEYIAYTTSKTSVTIFEIATKKYRIIDGFTNIYNLKYINNNQLLVVDYNTTLSVGNIKIINNKEQTNADTLPLVKNKLNSTLTLQNLNAIDIYYKENDIFIGAITNNTFTLFTYKNQHSIQSATSETTTVKSDYSKAFLVAINSENQLIAFKNVDDKPYMSVISSTSPTPKTKQIKDDLELQKIDLLEYNNSTYLLATTSQNICLFSLDDYKDLIYSIVKSTINIECNKDKIYIASSHYSIESATISTNNDNDISINLDKVLICSDNSEIGRFNTIDNLHINGNTIYISDTKNDRIQIIDNNKCYSTEEDEHHQPRAITVDKYGNIYFIDDSSQLIKYSFSGNTFAKIGNGYSNSGIIADTTITSSGEIYLIDSTNDKLLHLTNSGLKSKANLPINIDSNAKIEYIKYLNVFALLNNNQIYILDTLGNPIGSSITINNCKAITTDLNSIYALTNNKIVILEIVDEQLILVDNEILHDSLTNLSTITYDISNEKMYGFDINRQAIVYFEYTDTNNPLNFENFATLSPLKTKPLAIEIQNNATIYDMPYLIGNTYSNIISCIGIEEFDDYFRVLFNHNKTLKCGFIEKIDCRVIDYDITETMKMTATNIHVNLYKFPTTLPIENSNKALINSTINMHNSITLSKVIFPITIDPVIDEIVKQFYIYKNNDEINFVYTADVIPYTDKVIEYLNTPNGSVKSVTKESIKVYADTTGENVLFELNDGDRIYIESYDKTSEYTKIIYKDSNKQKHEGFILTEFVELDKLDNSKIILIVIIIASVAILATIITTYFVIRKKK